MDGFGDTSGADVHTALSIVGTAIERGSVVGIVE